MTTAEVLSERALALAAAETETQGAVEELLATSGERRVAVIMARRHLLEEGGDATDARRTRAAELLDEVLRRLPEV